MFLSHTENAHIDRQEKHQPHVSTKPKLGPSRSEVCDKRTRVRQAELLYYAVS